MEAKFLNDHCDYKLRNEFNLNSIASLFILGKCVRKHCSIKKTGSGVFIMKIIHYIY